MSNTQQTPLPGQPDHHVAELVAPEAFSQYLLRSSGEITFVLRSLITGEDRVTVYFNEGRDFLLTTLIAMDGEGLVLDYGSSAEVNKRALAADKLFCVTSHDKVRVQFQLRGIQQVQHEGQPAFRAQLPDTVLRLQRREYYRLTTPVARPLKCSIPVPNGNGRKTIEINIIDISGGGLSVVALPDDTPFEADTVFQNCRIELPEVGVILTALRIRNVFEITLKNGSRLKRSGCQFVNLPGPMLTLIQRYIIKVERERKARESGMG